MPCCLQQTLYELSLSEAGITKKPDDIPVSCRGWWEGHRASSPARRPALSTLHSTQCRCPPRRMLLVVPLLGRSRRAGLHPLKPLADLRLRGCRRRTLRAEGMRLGTTMPEPPTRHLPWQLTESRRATASVNHKRAGVCVPRGCAPHCLCLSGCPAGLQARHGQQLSLGCWQLHWELSTYHSMIECEPLFGGLWPGSFTRSM